jgi:hypothetical protein
VCCGWRWTASAIPSDCQTERWRDYTRDHLARGELIYLALRFTAEDFPRFSSISNSIC